MQIFNDKKKRIGTLSGFKSREITTTLDSGDKELSFSYPAAGALVDLLKEEYYIRTKTDEFVIKAVEKGEQFNKYTAVLNVEELEGTPFPYGFESNEQTIKACLEFAFEGTGWHVGTCTVKKKRTIDEQESVTAWDVLQKCLTTYRCECIIHSLTKTIDIYDRIGNDKGCYFMEGLNLRKISLKSDTYDFYTRIYPIGKDGITPEWLTGKDYIDNFQYSSKIKAYVWKDERYTNTTSLIEDATAKIEEMSRPYKAYTAEVVDLAKASEEYKDILSYGIGDTVTLVSKKTRTREKQRIVKITEYPESPEKNTVEISNARKTFAEIQKEETAAATEEAVSISNRATKKVLENYSTTEEIETKITASKEAVEAGVAYTLKNYYTSVQMDSLIKATKEEVSQEVKHVEENSMHNYVVNGDFSNGLDDNWYNSNETNNAVMDVSGLGTVAKILKTSTTSSYIRQTLGKLPAGTYRVRYKAATAAGYENTARVQVGALGSYSTTSSGTLKSKEFTTIEREITVSEGTKYIYIYAYTQNAPVYIKDVEVLGLYSLYADAKIQVTAEEITSEVKKKVNSDDFGTLITQNAYNVRVAFNNGSSYMQFDSTGITMYTGTITDNTKRTRFDYNGEHFYRDGNYVGKIGTNIMKNNDSQRGLVFDIEYNTAYMSWSNKESQNADVYTMKWSYCTQQCGDYEANMLHAGADINMHFYKLRNVSFEDGSITGTLTFKQPLEVGSDGKLTKWSTATLEFRQLKTKRDSRGCDKRISRGDKHGTLAEH